MKKNILVAILSISMITVLSACGNVASMPSEGKNNAESAVETKDKTVEENLCKEGHTWIEATCTEAKACSVCGKTEGAALGHEWKENTPNYQEAKTCLRCGETEGKPIDAEYELEGLKYETEWDKPYNTVITCSKDKSKTTVAKVTYTNYERKQSDESNGLEAIEGYEWLTFDIDILLDDENVNNYGYGEFGYDVSDYYGGLTDYEETEEGMQFTVNYKGIDYPECLQIWQGIKGGEWNENTLEYTIPMCIRVPVDYDGITIVMKDQKYSGDELYNLGDDGVFFRVMP